VGNNGHLALDHEAFVAIVASCATGAFNAPLPYA
jgi:hypothetical protein